MSHLDFALTGSVRRRAILAAAIVFGALPLATAAQAADPIKIGLVTALSGQSARAGEAIARGATIAIDEINAKGGVLGRQLELVRRDDESNPAKGLTAARELIQRRRSQSCSAGSTRRCSLPSCPLSTTQSSRSWCRGPPAPTSRRTARR